MGRIVGSLAGAFNEESSGIAIYTDKIQEIVRTDVSTSEFMKAAGISDISASPLAYTASWGAPYRIAANIIDEKARDYTRRHDKEKPTSLGWRELAKQGEEYLRESLNHAVNIAHLLNHAGFEDSREKLGLPSSTAVPLHQLTFVTPYQRYLEEKSNWVRRISLEPS